MITEKIQIHKPLTEAQKDELLKQIADAYLKINQKEVELKEFKDQIKEDIEEQQGLIDMSIGSYRMGYIPENVECIVKYTDGKTQYVSVLSGEIIEEHETTEEEQLKLTEQRVDAEDIIRADSDRG